MAENDELARGTGETGELATAEEVVVFQERLMRLLEHQTAIYTQGDSTSVPKHVAADLLRGVCFVLGIDPERPEVPARLLAVDLNEEFRRRLREVEGKVELTAELWRQVVASMPAIPSISLEDTVASIGNFPRQYDWRSMAHEVAADFDYQLCLPVPDTIVGIDYIAEYLRRLLIENEFLAHFDRDVCIGVLTRVSPDFAELLINLYEPVATNAIGRALLARDPRPLRLAEEDRAAIAALLAPLSAAGRERALREGADAACDALGIADDAARDYLRALAGELLPRVELGLARGDLSGVWV